MRRAQKEREGDERLLDFFAADFTHCVWIDCSLLIIRLPLSPQSSLERSLGLGDASPGSPTSKSDVGGRVWAKRRSEWQEQEVNKRMV